VGTITRDDILQLLDSGLVEEVSFRCGHCLRLSPKSSHECFRDKTEFRVEKEWLGGRCGYLITITCKGDSQSGS